MQTQPQPTEHSATSSSAARAEPTLVRLPVEKVPGIVDHYRLLPLLESVAERSRGRWTLRNILEEIGAGRWVLWVIWHADAVHGLVGTELYAELSGKQFCAVRFAVGPGTNPHRQFAQKYAHMLIEQIEAYAAEAGASAVDGWMRRGYAKLLPDYSLSHVLLEKDLA